MNFSPGLVAAVLLICDGGGALVKETVLPQQPEITSLPVKDNQSSSCQAVFDHFPSTIFSFSSAPFSPPLLRRSRPFVLIFTSTSITLSPHLAFP